MIRVTNLRDSHKYYKRKSENPVDVKTYLHIVTGFIAFKMRKMFEGYDIELSGGKSLGTVGIRGRRFKRNSEGKLRGLSINWKETNILWAAKPEAKVNREFIYYLNEHSNGVRYNLVWWKAGMKIGNKLLYSLTFSKMNKRKLTKLIREGKEYITD